VVGLSNETVDELVDQAVGIRLPKDASPAEFAAAVDRLCGLPRADYDRLCQCARERVKHLDWSTVADRLMTAYGVLADEKAAAQAAKRAWRPRVFRVISRVRQVPQRTWLFAGLTVAISVLVYFWQRRRT
jgi:hypothetical protein